MPVVLRDVADTDLDEFFEWEREPRAVQMAAFTRPDPSDRTSFEAHYQRARSDPSVTLRAVDDDGVLVGPVASFSIDGDREVSYWINPGPMGRRPRLCCADRVLRIETARPLFARVAEHNTGSAKVLTRAGFTHVGVETSFANGVGPDVLEHIYQLAP